MPVAGRGRLGSSGAFFAQLLSPSRGGRLLPLPPSDAAGLCSDLPGLRLLRPSSPRRPRRCSPLTHPARAGEAGQEAAAVAAPARAARLEGGGGGSSQTPSSGGCSMARVWGGQAQRRQKDGVDDEQGPRAANLSRCLRCAAETQSLMRPRSRPSRRRGRK